MVNYPKRSSSSRKWWFLGGFLSSICLSLPAQANRLETFVFDITQNRIEFATEKGVAPQGKIIENPTRLVIDLPGATYQGPTVRKTIGQAVQAVRVGQVNAETTRLVVEFAPNLNLDAENLKLKSLDANNHWTVQLPKSVAAANANSSSAYTWPLNGILTAGFGWRIHPITGQRTLHKGIDIAAPIGAPILAAADGTVTYAEWDSGGYGNLLEISHQDGSRTWYAHLNKFLVGKGQSIKKGQLVAEVGTTGRSTGPHLHFEVQLDGKRAVDPITYLPLRYVLFDVASR